MASTTYFAADHQEWDAAGLEVIQDAHEMTYCNQEEDGPDQLRGEWFIADDESRTIVWGSFGNDNSPGSSHYTYAEVYDDGDEYRAELAKWEAKPEYVETDEDEDEDAEDDEEPEDAEEPEEGDYTSTDHQHWYQHGKLVLTVPADDDHVAALRAHMEREQFFPAAWLISDHGNAHRINLDATGGDQ